VGRAGEIPGTIRSHTPPPIGWGGTVLFFGSGGLLLYAVIHWLIPTTGTATGIEPVLLWFLLAGSFFILPMAIVAALIVRSEGRHVWCDLWRARLRFHPMSSGDYLWIIAALVVIGILTTGSMTVVQALYGDSHRMFFVPMEPLGPGRYWILTAWVPFFVLNILGEEFVWRGVVLPRQEVPFGRWAWVVNGMAHLLIHLPTGLPVMLTLWPTAFILPYVVQRRRNTWVGVAVHGALNGPGFVAVALGFV
jgi:membrane protease YdiL (CAAX protease family)